MTPPSKAEVLKTLCMELEVGVRVPSEEELEENEALLPKDEVPGVLRSLDDLGKGVEAKGREMLKKDC